VSPKKDGIHGMAQVDSSTPDSSSRDRSPAAGSFLAAGRRSWSNLWLTPLLKNSSVGLNDGAVYYDTKPLIQKRLRNHESVRFLFFGSDDVLAISTEPERSDPSQVAI